MDFYLYLLGWTALSCMSGVFMSIGGEFPGGPGDTKAWTIGEYLSVVFHVPFFLWCGILYLLFTGWNKSIGAVLNWRPFK